MPSNRDRLVQAASLLFHRQGYHATGIEDVLGATGVSRSNLYYHFSGKAGLAVAVVEHWIGVYEADLVAPSLGDEARPPLERMERLFALAAASQDPATGNTGCPLGRLASDLAGDEPRVRTLLQDYFSDLRRRIRTTLAEAQGRGAGFGDDRLDGLAEMAISILEGGLLLSHLRGDGAGLSEAGATFVALVDHP